MLYIFFEIYHLGIHPCNDTLILNGTSTINSGLHRNDKTGAKKIKERCCNKWTNKLNHNLKSIMKVMRFANHRGKSGLFSYAVDKQNPNQLDFNTMIPWCKFSDSVKQDNDGEKCQLFQPIVTDLGMCHAFNPTPILDMLKPSYFTESFNEAFNEDLIFNQSLK